MQSFRPRDAELSAQTRPRGLEGLTERSRRPYRHPNQLPFQIEAQIVRLKQDKPSWGAPKIRERLVVRLYPDVHTPAISTGTAGYESATALRLRPICTLQHAGVSGGIREPFGGTISDVDRLIPAMGYAPIASKQDQQEHGGHYESGLSSSARRHQVSWSSKTAFSRTRIAIRPALHIGVAQ
jgi:hypothetical protein